MPPSASIEKQGVVQMTSPPAAKFNVFTARGIT
jgi:hypothetical protein